MYSMYCGLLRSVESQAQSICGVEFVEVISAALAAGLTLGLATLEPFGLQVLRCFSTNRDEHPCVQVTKFEMYIKHLKA